MSRYRDFFIESVEGQAYLRALEDLIQAEHTKAEDNPPMSRDHTQRAKGLREAINQAAVMSTESKKT
jgi:hypothetical protein